MRPGLHALLGSAGCSGKTVTADTVSYSLAPRLNAAGQSVDNAPPWRWKLLLVAT